MADGRPITPEQALLAVKAAGLDPDKSLNEQLNGPSQLDEQTVKGWVTEAVAEAIGAQGEAGQPPEQTFAGRYADALENWLTPSAAEQDGGTI
jgi:hypothetical protein